MDSTLHKTPQELLDHLENLGIETTTHEHEALFTVAQSQELKGDLPGVHCKSLFLKDKKQQLWLVVARHDAQIDLKVLKKEIGSAHLSFGRPEVLWDVLGVRPGSVTPFALINDREKQVKVVLDGIMMQGELVNYHPLTNEMTTALHPEDLRRFIRNCGHDFCEVDL